MNENRETVRLQEIEIRAGLYLRALYEIATAYELSAAELQDMARTAMAEAHAPISEHHVEVENLVVDVKTARQAARRS